MTSEAGASNPADTTSTDVAVTTTATGIKCDAKSASRKAPAKQTDGKLSALEAAAKVLGETKQPLTTRQMIEAMAVLII